MSAFLLLLLQSVVSGVGVPAATYGLTQLVKKASGAHGWAAVALSAASAAASAGLATFAGANPLGGGAVPGVALAGGGAVLANGAYQWFKDRAVARMRAKDVGAEGTPANLVALLANAVVGSLLAWLAHAGVVVPQSDSAAIVAAAIAVVNIALHLRRS